MQPNKAGEPCDDNKGCYRRLSNAGYYLLFHTPTCVRVIRQMQLGPAGTLSAGPLVLATVYLAGAAALTSSTSMVMGTSSPTTEEAPFTPKSLRLTLVLAEAPMWELPLGSCTGAEGPSTSRTTSLVTP